jgi:hypothetical protein
MSWNTFLRKNYEKMKQLGIDLKELNNIRLSGGEHFKHQLVKFLICHHLFKLKHHFKTEQPLGNSICDIIDLDTFTVYEIESNVKTSLLRKKLEDFYHPLIEDILVVDMKKLKRWNSVFALKEEVGEYCGLR